VCAPAAEGAPARPPVAALLGGDDRLPQRLHLALGGHQVPLVGGVAQHLAAAEVDQLQHPRDHASGAPHDQCVELHLEQGLGLERLAGCLAGLVVDHPDLPGRGDVEPVDEPAEQQLGLQQRLDVQLALGGLEPGGILEREVATERLLAGRQPRADLRALGAEHLGDRRLGLQDLLPGRHQQVGSPLGGPVGCGQVEEVLEDLVHDGAAHRIRRGRLREPVDRAIAEQQRTGHEVAGAARRQRAEHLDPVDDRPGNLDRLAAHPCTRLLVDCCLPRSVPTVGDHTDKCGRHIAIA
jgi:hypothetical protein